MILGCAPARQLSAPAGGSADQKIAAVTRAISRRPRVFCMEWVDPPYCGGHWMKELVEIAGGKDELAVAILDEVTGLLEGE